MNVIPIEEPLSITATSRRKATRRGLDGRNAHLIKKPDTSFIAAPGGSILGPTRRLLDIGCDKGIDERGRHRQLKVIAHVEQTGPAQRRLLLTYTADVALVFLPSGPFGYFVTTYTAATLRRGGAVGDFVWLRGGVVVPCGVDRSVTHHLDPDKIAALIDLRRPDGRRRLPPVDVLRVVTDTPDTVS